MFEIGKRYDGAVRFAAGAGRRVIEASKSPEPFYSFVSPQGIVDYLNTVNNDREIFMPARLLSSFQLGSFQGGFRPVGNILDAIDRRFEIKGSYGRVGSYPVERVGLPQGRKGREEVGRIHVSTNYIHFRGFEERFEEIRLELIKKVNLVFNERTDIEVGPGLIGLTAVGEQGSPPRIEDERRGMFIYHEGGGLSPRLPGVGEVFPDEIFFKEEWKVKKKKDLSFFD